MKQMKRLLLIPMLAAAALAGAASAQTEAGPPPSFYRQVIPVDTGRNGYEEFVLASDLIARHPAKARIGATDLTLSEARKIVTMAETSRVIMLVQRGVAKPVVSPRESLSLATLLPELSGFRQIARLLSMQLWVQLAGGDTEGAAATAYLGFSFGESCRIDTLIGYMVGIAMTRITLSNVAANLDRWSARDCERLYNFCLAQTGRRTALELIVNTELRFSRQITAELLKTALTEGPAAAAKALGLDAETDETRALAAAARPEVLQESARHADQAMRLQADRVLRQARRMPWQREPLRTPEGLPPMAHALVNLLMPSWQAVLDREGEEDAAYRLMALHLLIRRFWWEYGRYPAHLRELGLTDLIIDPFSGKELEYEASGESYRLRSVGPEAPGASPDDPRIENGRRPVDLIP